VTGHCQRAQRAVVALWLGVSSAVLLSAPTPCAAQRVGAPPAAGISLETESCPDSWADGLSRFVQIELGAESPEATARALHVAVRCDGDLVDIDVAHGVDASRTQRRMDLSATAASVRGRVVALAIAGLVRELALSAPEPRAVVREREPPSSTAPAVAPASVSETSLDAGDVHPDADEPTRAVQADLLLLAGNFTVSDDVVWGAGARLHLLALAPWRPAFDLQAGTYARDTELGRARLVSGSVGARLGWTIAGRDLALTPGLGQRLGLARASASVDDPAAARADAVVAPWTASFAFMTFEAAAFGRCRIGVDAELGVVQVPVRGRIDRGDDVDVNGLWLSLSALFGVQL
jgi:hypothetical protein